jgi:hypothetical protein
MKILGIYFENGQDGIPNSGFFRKHKFAVPESGLQLFPPNLPRTAQHLKQGQKEKK